MLSPLVCTLALACALAGCAGKAQPSVLPRLDSLPDEHVAREARLDSASARPGPESQKPKTKEWRHVETAAATAAAIVGSIFSTTKTVTIGVSAPMDENELIQPGYRDGERRTGDEDAGAETYDPNDLTPWVRLGRPDPE